MKIGNSDTNEKVVVIAEIGNNHEGDFALAKEMIVAAAENGADAVKFQTIKPELLNRPQDTERLAKLKKFEFSDQQFIDLAEFARANNIAFMSTPFYLEAVELLDGIVAAFKISSGDNNFTTLIEKVARTGKPVIMSTGMAGYGGISRSFDLINKIWDMEGVKQEIALLHCVSSYPVEPRFANLSAVTKIKDSFDCVAGYSDHLIGIDAAVASVCCGARIIEKHFTVDKNHSDFRDHQLSADPADLKLMVEKIREIELMLGDPDAEIQECEQGSVLPMTRSAYACREIKAGSEISAEDIVWLRPSGGIRPDELSELFGKKAKGDIAQGDCILKDMIS